MHCTASKVSPVVAASSASHSCTYWAVLPARSPNLNAYAERWVRSVKEECLCKVILFGERSLRRALSEYVEHFHAERNHQGKGNVLLFPRSANTRRGGACSMPRATGQTVALLPSGGSVTASPANERTD